MEIVVREALDSDIDEIVALFCESGSNPYGWNREKWRHYYRDYPDGTPISLIATVDGKVVGHYGLQPIKIGEIPAMLGLHAYVASSQRGLTIISGLMKEVDLVCILRGAQLICGFANAKFSLIKSTIFKWKTPCWLGFQNGLSEEDVELSKSKKFYFNYSDAWLSWRFGSIRDSYVSVYLDVQKNRRIQLLKFCGDKLHLQSENIEVWSPRSIFSTNQPDIFCQPFSIKVFEPTLINEGILKCENWSIDMGDSDTFQYTSEESYK